MQNKQHIYGSFPNLNIIFWRWQEFKFCHTEARHVTFLCFSEDKSSELQYHFEQDKQQLRPSHIISITYLDLDQAYATHEFQVQSKFSYQHSLIQNSGEFQAKNQVLERNYNRATIHHFYFKRLSSESIYLALKNRNLDTHTFYFVFIFKISHY